MKIIHNYPRPVLRRLLAGVQREEPRRAAQASSPTRSSTSAWRPTATPIASASSTTATASSRRTSILALLALYLKRYRNIPGGLARSVATTHLIDAIAKKLDVPLYETPVGFKYIGELILDDKIAMGGEESAGMSMYRHLPEKDGILACLLVAEMVARTGKKLNQLIEEMYKEFGYFYSKRIDMKLTPQLKDSLAAEARQSAGGDRRHEGARGEQDRRREADLRRHRPGCCSACRAPSRSRASTPRRAARRISNACWMPARRFVAPNVGVDCQGPALSRPSSASPLRQALPRLHRPALQRRNARHRVRREHPRPAQGRQQKAGRKPTVRVLATSCLDLCDHGPNMIVERTHRLLAPHARDSAVEVYDGEMGDGPRRDDLRAGGRGVPRGREGERSAPSRAK